MDRLLGRALDARATPAEGGACLDADTLAAWADEALGSRERAGVEAHAADCARCQALLAAMVRTSPPPAASRWRVPSLGWLVPLTAAATVAAIWVAVPSRPPVQVSDGGVEATDQVRQPSAPPATAAPVPAPRALSREMRDDQLQAKKAEASADASAASNAAREKNRAELLEKRDAPAVPGAANAPAASAATLAAPDAAPQRQASPPPLPAAPPPATAGSAVAADSLLSGRVATFRAGTEVVVVSSNPATRFRLLRGGNVQRSADAGATWRTETTGAAESLTAGASPSPSVCWLVGPAGTVLLSSDGRSWRRVAFPEAVDLRAVTATDAENATVTAADGRAFATADGGQTWTRTPD